VATSKPPSSAGWLNAIAVLFCIFGTAMLTLAIYQTQANANGLAAFAAISGVIFVGVGIGLILTLGRGALILSATDRLRQQHPDAPWLWRSDWAQGHIFSEGSSNAFSAWLVATFGNAIAWPIFYFGRSGADWICREGDAQMADAARILF
jgi:hypothetical protein